VGAARLRPLRSSDPGAAALDRLESVYREHHGFVWSSVRRLGVPDHAAADAVHEVFMVVARRLPQFEGRSSMRTWLFGISMRVVKNLRRSDHRHRRRTDALAQRVEGAPPADAYARSEAAATLHRLLDGLDDDKRAVFILAELEGMSAPEIAEATGANVNTVYARLRAARKRMEQAVQRLRSREGGAGS
jgi:RNA polymerase sigma-70 factor, ECF subfamily